MIKSPRILGIMSVAFLLYGCLALLFSFLYRPETPDVKKVTDVQVSGLEETTVLYFEDLEVIRRYAFQTADEYYDSESGYSDITYRVYDASQPMDRYELYSEYYLVSFCDQTGTKYITSMTVAADKAVGDPLSHTPVTIPACASAIQVTGDSKFLNSNDKELIALREAALDACTEQTGIPRAEVRLSYRSGSIEEFLQSEAQDASSSRILSAVFGVILLAGGVFLLRLRKRKAAGNDPAVR